MQPRRMRNSVFRGFVRALMYAFESVVAVSGLGIFFGDLFFWQSGSPAVHIYSLLSLLSWTVGGVLLMIDRLNFYVAFAGGVHLLATVLAALANYSFSLFVILLAGTDIALIAIAWTQHRHQFRQRA